MRTIQKTSPVLWASPRLVRLLLALALAPFIVLALWHLRAPLDLSIGDQAHYLLHADAILDGRSYTDNGYIHYPPIQISPGAYPPGLPLLLALTQALGGGLVVMRLLMVAGAAAFFYVAARYFVTLDDRWLGPAAVFACAFVPQLTLFASGLYTDFIFAALVWTCFLLVDRPGEWDRRRIGWLCAFGALAIAFRTVGVALIPALAVYQVWRSSRYGEPWKRSLPPLLVWLVVYGALEMFFPTQYAQQITTAMGDSPAGASSLLMLQTMLDRALAYRAMLSELQLTPFPWRMANRAYHLAALLFLVFGTLAWVHRGGLRFLFCFVLFYLPILLVVPWPSSRSLWPVLPAVWFATLEGIRQVAHLVTRDPAPAVRMSLASVVLLAIVTVSFGPKPDPLIGVGDLPEGRALYATLAAEAAKAPVRTLFFSPRDPARLPGVAAMAVPELPPDAMIDELRTYRITHAIVGSLGNRPEGDRRLAETIRHYPEQFYKVYENGQFALYRVIATPGPSSQGLEHTGTP